MKMITEMKDMPIAYILKEDNVVKVVAQNGVVLIVKAYSGQDDVWMLCEIVDGFDNNRVLYEE